MNVFYEEDGSFKVAAIFSENPGSLQVESVSGKRSKIKLANVILRFDSAIANFMTQAQQNAEQLDIAFIWQCCSSQEFAVQTFAQDYYGREAQALEVAALCLALHSAPIYFHRKGKGRYKAAPPEILEAALAGQQKRQLQQQQMADWVAQLLSGSLPAEWQSSLNALLHAPDKNSLQWKALDQACQQSQRTALALLDQLGAIPNHEHYHFDALARQCFPHGWQFSPAQLSSWQLPPDDLPKASTPAFSIDDITTTEIDDAFSVLPLDHGGYLIGVHIAAPALGVTPGSELDMAVQRRLSTVYLPGRKITMLPPELIQHYSLDAGGWRPALSWYVELDSNFHILQTQTRLEQVYIADNLRHDAIEPYFNSQQCTQDNGHPYWLALSILYQAAVHFEQQRGKADSGQNQQRDYSFYVEQGLVRIVERQRGTPLDKLVSEWMIALNQHWGACLAEHSRVGIYRAQQNSKVYMTLRAEPHQGLGVAQYAWSSSPLRRAIDLFNQRQLLSIYQQVPAPYELQDAVLGGVMQQFDSVYQQYRDFQTRMERYWCLQYLQQTACQAIRGTLWRDNLVRLDGMPYVCKVNSLPALASGTRVNLQIQSVDTLQLQLQSRFISVIEGETASVALDDEQALHMMESEPIAVDASATQPQTPLRDGTLDPC